MFGETMVLTMGHNQVLTTGIGWYAYTQGNNLGITLGKNWVKPEHLGNHQGNHQGTNQDTNRGASVTTGAKTMVKPIQ